jgi:hypothetical protein
MGQQMSTRVVLGGDFRHALNSLTHGDEEGLGQFLPYRKGSSGLHLAEAIGLVSAGLPRAEQLALGKYYGAKLNPVDAAAAKPMTREQAEKHEGLMRTAVVTALDWFKDEKAALLKQLADGGTLERFFVVLNDPARESIAVRMTAGQLKRASVSTASAPAVKKKGGFFSRLFGRG